MRTEKALVAVAHSLLVVANHLIKKQETYRELGGNYFDQLNPKATEKRLVRRLEQLGYNVGLDRPMSVAA